MKSQAKVTLSAEDMHHVKRLTGEGKAATAIQMAVLQWLRLKGIQPTTKDERGGYRSESPAYHAGYNWGKRAKEQNWDIDMWDDGATVDSEADFEAWAEREGIELNQSNFAAWCKGTAAGWQTAGGAIPILHEDKISDERNIYDESSNDTS